MLSVASWNITRPAYIVNLPFTIVLSAESCQSTRRLIIGSVFLLNTLPRRDTLESPTSLCHTLHGVIVVRGKISSSTVQQLIHMSLCLLHCYAGVPTYASKFRCKSSSFPADSLEEPHCGAGFAEGCETSCLTLAMHRLSAESSQARHWLEMRPMVFWTLRLCVDVFISEKRFVTRVQLRHTSFV